MDDTCSEDDTQTTNAQSQQQMVNRRLVHVQRQQKKKKIEKQKVKKAPAHNDSHRNRGFSPWQLLLGKTPTDKTPCEDPDLAQCSFKVVDEAAK